MELITPLTSTAIRFLTEKTIGSAHAPVFVEGLKDRYQFWEAPKGPADFTLDTGVKFAYGRFQKQLINTVQIFSNGVSAQGNTNTQILSDLIDDLLGWVKESYGSEFVSAEPVSTVFTSSIEVRVDPDFAARFEALIRLDRIAKILSDYGLTVSPYTVSSIALQTDPPTAKPFQPGRFVLERRANIPFERNIFYSEAPVSTEQHLDLLAELERSLMLKVS